MSNLGWQSGLEPRLRLSLSLGLSLDRGERYWGSKTKQKKTLAQSVRWLLAWLVGLLAGPGWNMQLCIFKFMFLHLPLLRLTRSLAPSLCPIAVNIKLQQFSMTRLDWSRRRELHFGNGWSWGFQPASQPARQAGSSGGSWV